MSDEELKCLWDLGGKCEGEVRNRTFDLGRGEIFDCPVCDTHFNQHEEVMRLVGEGHDIEKVLDDAMFLPDEEKEDNQ